MSLNVRSLLTRTNLPAVGVVFVAIHLFLDWVSFIHEMSPVNITPWNPQAGLSMGMLIAFGPRMVPVSWLALTLGDAVVRGLPIDLWATMVSNALIAGLYGVAAWLMRSRFGVTPGLERVRDIVMLIGGTGLATAAVGAAYIAVLMAVGLFPWSDFIAVFIRYWVGDVIGITVLTPFILAWLRAAPVRWSWRGALEAVLQAAAIAAALWADFGALASDQYEYFYLLFLPVVWVAARHGLVGATAAALVTQIGLIIAIQVTDVDTARMTHFQLLMLALTITGQLLGGVVSDRRRVEAWVRERQAEFAHASRLTEAGEMTAALAHEINQPLTATMSYARAARKIAARDGASPQLREILDKVVAQAERADRVMRSLRDFVRKGDSRRQAIDVTAIIAESLILAGPLATQNGVAIATNVPPGLPAVYGDPVQLQQVLLNLVRNAVEAVAESRDRPRQVTVSARRGDPGFITVSVHDTGPGLPDLVERNLFVPFVTTKATGMGLGLSIARSIIEAHGGTLGRHRHPDGGTVFSFTLPVSTIDDDDNAQ